MEILESAANSSVRSDAGKNHNRTSPSPICRSLLVLRVAVFVLALHFDSRYLTFEQTGASFCNILLKRTKNGVVISNFDVEQSKIGGERWVALVSMLTVRWLGPQDSLVLKKAAALYDYSDEEPDQEDDNLGVDVKSIETELQPFLDCNRAGDVLR